MDRKAIKWWELLPLAMLVLVVLVAYLFYMAGHAQGKAEGWAEAAEYVKMIAN